MFSMISMVDMVDVRFYIKWNIVVVYVSDMRNVQIMCNNVGCNQNINYILFDMINSMFMQRLRDIIVQSCCFEVMCVQLICQMFSILMSMYEYDRSIGFFGFKQMSYCFIFFYIFYYLVLLFNFCDCLVRTGYVNIFWIMQKMFNDFFNYWWYSGREQYVLC